MRRLFLLPMIVVLALPLGGCAGTAESFLNLPTGVLTASVQNPVTKATLYKLENGLRVGVRALVTYRDLCDNGTLEASCIAVVTKLQAYSRRARPLLKQLRVFVRKNDQVNASVVYEQVKALITEIRATTSAAGIQLPQGAI
jgi:hypothetical protein